MKLQDLSKPLIFFFDIELYRIKFYIYDYIKYMEKFYKPVDTKIILSEDQKYLDLNELLIFPHGLDGLHIWEAGIILARFII
jgi:hypothetical protein